MIVVEQVDAESPWEINSESNGVVNERFFRALWVCPKFCVNTEMRCK